MTPVATDPLQVLARLDHIIQQADACLASVHQRQRLARRIQRQRALWTPATMVSPAARA